MDRMIYTAASGAARVLEQQSVINNNLANVGTTGFREQLAVYRAVPVEDHVGLPTRVSTATATVGSSSQQGALVETGKGLNAAVVGQGWFSVQTPVGERYTRAGEFLINDQGVMVTPQGFPVVSEDGGSVVITETGDVGLAQDGRVTVRIEGGNQGTQQVGRLKLVNPGPEMMARSDDGLFRIAEGGSANADPEVRIAPGFIEKSNVNPASTLVAMISNSRLFEMQMKVVQHAGSNAERANSILSVA